VLPPSEDGTKRPLSERIPENCDHPDCVSLRAARKWWGWTHRQHRRASERIIRCWYKKEHRRGIGYVCGAISGGLLMIEFEARAVEDGTFDDFLDLAEDLGLGDLIDAIREGYEDQSPSGGIHWFVFCDDPITEVLASVRVANTKTGKGEWKPLIETRGEGSYAIAAPTSGVVHPSGKD
jgi:putative DNA primase/helicase